MATAQRHTDPDTHESRPPKRPSGLGHGARSWARSVVVRGLPYLGTVTGIETTESVVAFTFDDGPDPASTPLVLDALAAAGARATFFMIGVWAAANPELVERVVAEGHALGNHGWAHRSMVLDAPKGRRVARRWRREAIRRGAEAVGPNPCTMFRPPYGHQNVAVRLAARDLGHEVVGWRVAAGDWDADSPERIAARVLDQLEPGAIVLWHDALADAFERESFDRTASIEALRHVLDQSRERYRLVTVPELLTLGPARRRFVYPRPRPGTLPPFNR